MSPVEENYRTTKLRRVDLPDISAAVPGLGISFSNPPSGVFTFTATKNEHPGRKKGMSGMRCRVCNRPKLTKATSTTRKLWLPSTDDDIGVVNPFGTCSVDFKQSVPSRFKDDSKLCSTVPSDDQSHLGKNLEDVDQIVQKASEMVKLLESHITALQLSAQALKTPSERMIPVAASPMNSYLDIKDEEPANVFKKTNHQLMETRMSSKPHECCQQCPSLLNFGTVNTFGQTLSLSPRPSQPQSPAIFTFPCQTPSPPGSLSYTPSWSQSPAITSPSQIRSPTTSLSYTPSQPQSPAITCPCQTLAPSPTLSYSPSQPQSPIPSQFLEPSPMQRLSTIPCQETSSTPSLNVKNIVQRLESLSVSPSHFNQTPKPPPKYINEFTFPPLHSQSKLEKNNRFKTPTKAGSVVSSSSGVDRQFKPSYRPGQTGITALTRKSRLPTSKLIRSHRLPPRQQHSSEYEDYSGCSVSSTSWTTTQQPNSVSESDEEETDASSVSHPSKSKSSRSSESKYSTETTSSSASPINRPRLSISNPHTFTRHRTKKKPSVPNEKPISRLRKIKNKLGLIFHHHHHHHHHHDEESEPSRTKLSVVRQIHEAAAVKRGDQQGHFRAMLGALITHVRLNNKKKKSKPLKEIQRLKKKVQLDNVGKRRRGLKLPIINKKSKFKAVTT